MQLKPNWKMDCSLCSYVTSSCLQFNTFTIIICTVLGDHSSQLPKKRLSNGMQCRCMKRNWLVRDFHEAAGLFSENLQLLNFCSTQPTIVHKRHAQSVYQHRPDSTFPPKRGLSFVPAFSQHPGSLANITGCSTASKLSDYHIFQNVNNHLCSEHLPVLFSKCDSNIQHSSYEDHKRRVAANNLCRLACKNAQASLLCHAHCYLVFSSNAKNLDVILIHSKVILYLKQSHCLQTTTVV